MAIYGISVYMRVYRGIYVYKGLYMSIYEHMRVYRLYMGI